MNMREKRNALKTETESKKVYIFPKKKNILEYLIV